MSFAREESWGDLDRLPLRQERRAAHREERNGEDAYWELPLGMVFLVCAIATGIAATLGLAVSLWVAFGLAVPAAWLLGHGWQNLRRYYGLEPLGDGEQELLAAMRSSDGRITAAEAAAETSLSTSEADRVLSELASGGHLHVEVYSGALVYVLPSSRPPLSSPDE